MSDPVPATGLPVSVCSQRWILLLRQMDLLLIHPVFHQDHVLAVSFSPVETSFQLSLPFKVHLGNQLLHETFPGSQQELIPPSAVLPAITLR